MATKILDGAGKLHTACEKVSSNASDIEDWEREQYGLERKCKEWKPAEDILGFTSGPLKSTFRGVVDDADAHYEGNRARLEELFDEGKVAMMASFASWGMGTGVVVRWTETFDPSSNRQRGKAMPQISNEVVTRMISVVKDATKQY